MTANPYVPEVTSTTAKQSGQCLCVPIGKCVAPTQGQPLPPPGSNPLPPPIPGQNFPPVPPPTPNNVQPINTDGAGLIDVRIVNRVRKMSAKADRKYDSR